MDKKLFIVKELISKIVTLMSDKGVCRTALATLILLKIMFKNKSSVVFW